MSDETLIEWATHTGGPYLGCSEVSPGCLHCYARELALSRLERIFRAAYEKAGFADFATRPVWGNQATRVLTRGFWDQAFTLNRRAQKTGQQNAAVARPRMFPSMIDWLDEMPAGIIDQDGRALNPDQVLADFLDVVRQCDGLDWLLLTKRPETWRQRIQAAHNTTAGGPLGVWLSDWLDGTAPAHVWIGTTTEDQPRAEQRIPELLKIPAVVRFLSVEPMVGPVTLRAEWLELELQAFGGHGAKFFPRVDWVICGGESGHHARPMHPAWAREVRDACQAFDVPFFFKQWGAWLPEHQEMARERTALAEKVHTFDGGRRAFRVGKINAGALLDGLEHKEFPKGLVAA